MVERSLPSLSWRHSFAGGPVLAHLLCQVPGKLSKVWDPLAAHRSGAVWDFIRHQRGRILFDFPPACAPELNPVEYLWYPLEP
jgi:hypothetical protein